MNDFFSFLLVLLVWVVLIIAGGGAATWGIYHLLSRPMHRRHRALFFLDLLETGLRRGQTAEQVILSAAAYPDRSIGREFFVVAARIREGAPLGTALDLTPAFLPPQITAMLQAGETLGDLNKVLPACREVLWEGPDEVRSTMRFGVEIPLAAAPVIAGLVTELIVFVMPKFNEIVAGYHATPWPISRFVFHMAPYLVGLELIVFLVLIELVAAHVGGPSLSRWFRSRKAPIADWNSWQVPWKRKKLLRTFSAMLAVLLDSGVPEAEAVQLAGDSTANEICRRRARKAAEALARGVRLDEAIRCVDEAGEFRWRLGNAIHARGGFLDALRGWHEALDAQAFQQEATATHSLACGMVIVNGVVVGLVAVGLFGVLVMLLKTSIAAL